MAVIKTERNFVCAYEPLPEDSFVETWMTGSEGRHLLLTQTIDHYQAAVDWAVSFADHMIWPLEVQTFTLPEYLRRNRERLARAIPNVTPEKDRQLRKENVATLAKLMRDSEDHTVRTDAYNLLVDMGVVQHG